MPPFKVAAPVRGALGKLDPLTQIEPLVFQRDGAEALPLTAHIGADDYRRSLPFDCAYDEDFLRW
jgi:hypothetical protein